MVAETKRLNPTPTPNPCSTSNQVVAETKSTLILPLTKSTAAAMVDGVSSQLTLALILSLASISPDLPSIHAPARHAHAPAHEARIITKFES